MRTSTIELSMIVKNGGSSLARCLQSVRGVVDHIVIGDTGSTDDTAEIARAFGAEWITIPWNSDFAEARNLVLQQATCDWILVLDADEMLDPKGALALKRLVSETDRFAFDVVRWNYVRQANSRSGTDGAMANPQVLPEAEGFPAYVTSINTRLFRRHAGIWFERPVHETVVYRVKELGLSIGQAPFVIHHFGHAEDDEAVRDAKNELYLEIGKRHLEAFPEDSRTAYELGWGALEYSKNPQAALDLLIRAIQLDESNTEAIILGGVCLLRMWRYAEAVQLFSHAVERHSSSIVLYESLGDAHLHQQQYQAASEAYNAARSLGGASALILAKYGVCQIYLGQMDEGMDALRKAHRMEPDHAELLDIVIAGAVTANEITFAADLAKKRLEMEGASDLHRSIANYLDPHNE
ncbi:glycosyltransferase [Terriglobus albidus]|uniref:Glycosyltransferase n=1 Tax=Terriglobus albidus TaxID=1592106 RepID=A0A5B9EG41_9BACT|nr:glycosyltransferase [Terriglobus albidus]QEE29760.1 glycosyltransferase [Terriglobus albidus]